MSKHKQQTKILHLFIGPPGSGKTFKAKEIISNAIKNDIPVNQDCICETYKYPGLCYPNDKNQYIITKSKLPMAKFACKVATENLMKKHTPIIIQSNSNTTIDDILPYLELARKYNYNINFVCPTNNLLYYIPQLPDYDDNDIDQINLIKTIKTSEYPNIYLPRDEIAINIFDFRATFELLTDYKIIKMTDPNQIIGKMLECHILESIKI